MTEMTYYKRLTARGKRRAAVSAVIWGIGCSAVIAAFGYGACFIVHMLQTWAGVV